MPYNQPLKYNMVILYVDDDADDLQLFGEAVRQLDASITFVSARSAEDALDFLSGEIFPDVVFMDINMPVMNGLMCLAAIRSNPVLEHLPVVMISTSSSDREIDQSKSLGADFIIKPNSFQELINVIAKWLKQ
jgi:CheY-like chemotaxis protein